MNIIAEPNITNRYCSELAKLRQENEQLKDSLVRLVLAWSHQPLMISHDGGERLRAMQAATKLVTGHPGETKL